MLLLAAGAIVGLGYGVSRGIRAVTEATAETERELPTTTVRRGDVEIAVPALGELQGGGSEDLTVPPAGAAELPIIFLRNTGELVEAGDIVAEFDGSGQEYELTEAAWDLEEAEQRLIQAEAEAAVELAEARLAVMTAEADLRLAELDVRRNEVLPEIQQRQNEISLERARNRHLQTQRDYEHKQATTGAGIEVERAAVTEALARAETAERTMADLTLRAPSAGYVQLAEASGGISIIFSSGGLISGVVTPVQVGDTARPGQTIARIPDLSRFEVITQIPETDRAFLEVGQPVVIRPKAMPGREFAGHVSLLGGSTGNAWNRTFNCRVALDETDPGLRPGMTVDVVIHVETLEDVVWVPSQAIFDREGRWFVYRREPEGFITHEVTLVRRTESQAVVMGIDEGAVIALARPDQESNGAGPASGAGPSGPLGALPQ
jgi:multidrug resistance efflux pump